MSPLQLLYYPDKRLRVQAAPVASIDADIAHLIDGMLEIMYGAPGIGLAAPQVNVARRVIVVDVSEERNQPLVLVNPEIVERDGSEKMEEGCLSVPGIYEAVERSARVRVRALNRDEKDLDIDLDGLLAVCVQHEIDHLDGKLFVDYLSEMKRDRIRRKMIKLRRHTL